MRKRKFSQVNICKQWIYIQSYNAAPLSIRQYCVSQQLSTESYFNLQLSYKRNGCAKKWTQGNIYFSHIELVGEDGIDGNSRSRSTATWEWPWNSHIDSRLWSIFYYNWYIFIYFTFVKVYLYMNDFNAMCTEVYKHQHIQTGGNLFGL